MIKIKLTKEEVEYLRLALNFYCDETTHERKDLEEGAGVGLNPNLRESKVLDKVRKKLTKEEDKNG